MTVLKGEGKNFRHPRGKIGCLPYALRQEVNVRLRDGASAREVVAWLEEEHGKELKKHKFARLRVDNVLSWRRGGYKTWLTQQERLEGMKLHREMAFEIAQRSKGEFEAASLALAASHVYETLLEFDLKGLKERLKTNPELHGVIVEELTKLCKARLGEEKLQLELKRYQDEVAEKKRKLEAELGKAKAAGGLTAENIAAMEEVLKLL